MAEQATDYVNYVFTKDNPGWEILYSWFTDALLSKNGIVKVWWEEYNEATREEYKNLNRRSVQLQLCFRPEEVEVVEHTAHSGGGEYGAQPMQEMAVTFHDVVIRADRKL